jgi:AcrR family transcriptional regulator
MGRLSIEDWLKKGLAVLAEKGEDAMRIELLCKEMKVSKGSFYHHFAGAEEFIEALMKYWEEENTTSIIKETELETSTDGKIEKLEGKVIEKDHLAEVRIRAWAVRNPVVASYIEKVDKRRMEYLEKLHKERGADRKTATKLAHIEYAAFVGMQHLFRDLPMSKKKELSDFLYKLLKPN